MAYPDLPDGRIRFPAPKIDFTNDVGLTGQDHDTYPQPGQPRYDWERMYLIGLLSQQASYIPPSQKRIGTPWFDLRDETVKIWNGTAWAGLASFVSVGSTTLDEWYLDIKDGIVSALISESDVQAAINQILTDDSVYLTVEEADGSPSVSKTKTLIFPSNTVQSLGNGRVAITNVSTSLILVNGYNWRTYNVGPNWVDYTWSGGNPILTMAFDDTTIESVVAEDFVRVNSGDIYARVYYINNVTTAGNVRFVVNFGVAKAGDTGYTRASVNADISVNNSDSLEYVDILMPGSLALQVENYSNLQTIAYRNAANAADSMVGDFHVVDVVPWQDTNSEPSCT